MKPTNKAIEQAAYDVMRTHTQTITRLNHKPTRVDLINMKEEIETTLVNIDISVLDKLSLCTCTVSNSLV